jgi:ethanolamine transporter EutH
MNDDLIKQDSETIAAAKRAVWSTRGYILLNRIGLFIFMLVNVAMLLACWHDLVSPIVGWVFGIITVVNTVLASKLLDIDSELKVNLEDFKAVAAWDILKEKS